MPIERTSKPLKAAQALSLLIIIAALAFGARDGTPQGITYAAYGVAAGVGGYLLARIIGWWQYG